MPGPEREPLAPGTLWARVRERTQRALALGVLQSIPMRSEFVEDAGIRFLVRVAESLARKDEARKEQAGQGKQFDPFLPYDPELFVADLSPTHVCLLNKFTAVEHHILMVTRDFEDQECLLNIADFEALWACMAEFEGLGFYNGGEVAGASQRHKHLQMVPLPLCQGDEPVPIAPALSAASCTDGMCVSTRLPFRHALSWLDPGEMSSSAQAGAALLRRYRALLQAVGLQAVGMREKPSGDGETKRQSGPYNLLVTRQWMLLVPRSSELFQGIPVNALGFAGTLLVRDERQMTLLRDHGPMAVLRHVGVPNPG